LDGADLLAVLGHDVQAVPLVGVDRGGHRASLVGCSPAGTRAGGQGNYAAWVAAGVPSSSRCTSTVCSGVSTSRPRNVPLRSLKSIQSEAPCSMTWRASSAVIWRPLVDFQMTKPHPGSLRLFHDEQP